MSDCGALCDRFYPCCHVPSPFVPSIVRTSVPPGKPKSLVLIPASRQELGKSQFRARPQSNTEDFHLPNRSTLLQVSVKLVSPKLESADSGTADQPSASSFRSTPAT